MITISGLTAQQRKLADIAWVIDSEQQLRAFRDSLQGQQQRDWDLIIQLIVAAELDHCVDSIEDCELASEVLDQFR